MSSTSLDCMPFLFVYFCWIQVDCFNSTKMELIGRVRLLKRGSASGEVPVFKVRFWSLIDGKLRIYCIRGPSSFSIKVQVVNILGPVSHKVSVTITLLCCCSAKADIGTLEKCVAVFLKTIYGYWNLNFM